MNAAYCCTMHGQVHVWRWVLDPIPLALSAHSQNNASSLMAIPLHVWGDTLFISKCTPRARPAVKTANAAAWYQTTNSTGELLLTFVCYFTTLWLTVRLTDWLTDWPADYRALNGGTIQDGVWTAVVVCRSVKCSFQRGYDAKVKRYRQEKTEVPCTLDYPG
jgi:hypothetical protein